jgi:Coenzyme PQQ synthesis protein D (PqqD)
MTSHAYISPSVRSVVEPYGAVLLDIEQNLCMSLNPVGGFIWARMREGKPRDEILEDLVKEFAAVERGRLKADLDEFWRSLLDARVLEQRRS